MRDLLAAMAERRQEIEEEQRAAVKRAEERGQREEKEAQIVAGDMSAFFATEYGVRVDTSLFKVCAFHDRTRWLATFTSWRGDVRPSGYFEYRDNDFCLVGGQWRIYTCDTSSLESSLVDALIAINFDRNLRDDLRD